jgi:hypothetical protein
MSNSMYTPFNEVHLKGKIFKILNQKHYTDILLSVGHGPEWRLPKDKNGRYIRDIVRVRFIEGDSKNAIASFKEGDKVSIGAVTQTAIDVLTNRSKKTVLFGFTVSPMKEKEFDMNKFTIVGKIESAKAVSDKYIIINIKSNVEKKIKNTRESSETPYFIKNFKGLVSFGIRINDGSAKDLVYTKYTPGTWISASGYIQGRKNKQNMQEMRLITTKHEIVGQVQK